MPRHARLDIAGQLYHVIARGIERRKIFAEEEDYLDFLARLKRALDKTGCKCLAWCLMPNHFHLLILRGKHPLAELMRRLMTGYAVAFNIRHKRAGHLFQNRYKAVLCEAEQYLLGLVAYIHLNPLRAKLVRDLKGLERYRWCGHGGLLGTKVDGIIAAECVLEHFGGNIHEALKKYGEFMLDRLKTGQAGEYSGGGLIKSMGGMKSVLTSRRAGEKEAYDERVLGSGNFVESVLKSAGEKIADKNKTREEVMEEVVGITGIGREEIVRPSRKSGPARARAIYCHLCRETAGIRTSDLMRELKMTQSGIARLTARGRDLAGKYENKKI